MVLNKLYGAKREKIEQKKSLLLRGPLHCVKERLHDMYECDVKLAKEIDSTTVYELTGIGHFCVVRLVVLTYF